MDILDKVVAGQGEYHDSDLDYLYGTGQGRWRNLSRNIDLSDHRGPPLATPESRLDHVLLVAPNILIIIIIISALSSPCT